MVRAILFQITQTEKYAEILQEIYAKRASVVDVCKTARESTQVSELYSSWPICLYLEVWFQKSDFWAKVQWQ